MLNRDSRLADANHKPVENAERGDTFIPLDGRWRFYCVQRTSSYFEMMSSWSLVVLYKQVRRKINMNNLKKAGVMFLIATLTITMVLVPFTPVTQVQPVTALEYSTPEEVFSEFKRITRDRICDMSGVTYDRLRGNIGPQLPCPDKKHPGTPRLFTDFKFPRPDGRTCRRSTTDLFL